MYRLHAVGRIGIHLRPDSGHTHAGILGHGVAAVLRIGIDLDVPAQQLRIEIARAFGIGRRQIDPCRAVIQEVTGHQAFSSSVSPDVCGCRLCALAVIGARLLIWRKGLDCVRV